EPVRRSSHSFALCVAARLRRATPLRARGGRRSVFLVVAVHIDDAGDVVVVVFLVLEERVVVVADVHVVVIVVDVHVGVGAAGGLVVGLLEGDQLGAFLLLVLDFLVLDL